MWFAAGGPLLLNATAFEEPAMKLIVALTLSLLALTGCASEPYVLRVDFGQTTCSVEQLDEGVAKAAHELGYAQVRQVIAEGAYRGRLLTDGPPSERVVDAEWRRAEAVWSHVTPGPFGRASLSLDFVVRGSALDASNAEVVFVRHLRWLLSLEEPWVAWNRDGGVHALAIPGAAK